MKSTAVVVFATAPRAGAVKTRLCPPLSPAAAARLYRCFVLDVLDGVRAVRGITPVVAYAPCQARGFFEAAQPGTRLVRQAGADLGARRLAAELRSGRGHSARTRRLLGTAAWRTLVG